MAQEPYSQIYRIYSVSIPSYTVRPQIKSAIIEKIAFTNKATKRHIHIKPHAWYAV